MFKFLPIAVIKTIPLCILVKRSDFLTDIEKTGLLTEKDFSDFSSFFKEEEVKKCYPPQNPSRPGICKYIKDSKCPIIFQYAKQALNIAIPGFDAYVSTAQCGICAVRSIFKSRSCSSKCKNVLKNLLDIFKKPLMPLKKILQNVVNNVVNKVKNVAKSIVKGIGSVFGFGKRDLSGHSFTCDQIKLLGFSVSALTYEEIVFMNTNEFENCLSELASYDGYSDDAYAAFKIKITELYNMSSINDAKIIEMGSLVKGFQPDEMSLWTIQKMDTLASLSSLNLTRQQVSKFY